MTVNEVTLIGRLGKDPQYRELGESNHVCNFSLATSDSIKKDGDWHKVTDWHNVVVFGNQALACSRFIHKGSQVYVKGKVKNESYEKDGETKYITKVYASKVRFLDSKREESQSQQVNIKMPSESGVSAAEVVFDEDDLPF